MNSCAFVGGVHGERDLHTNDREIARWSWRITDSVDVRGGAGAEPLTTLSEFLAAHGLPTGDLARHSANDTAGVPVTAPCSRVAQLFISAAGSAAIAGAAMGKPSPVRAIPDVVAVVYDAGSPQLHRAPPSKKPIEAESLRIGSWQSELTDDDYAAVIDEVKAAIAAGDLYQANVVRHHSAAHAGDPSAALRAVSSLAGARYGGYLRGTDYQLATATPELLVRVADGVITTRPIKGTRTATALGRRALLASIKERAEHVMIVDLMRNDLARVATSGSVDVSELFVPKEWAGLWQAESTVSATVDDGVDLADVLAAVCPGGSVTGAPKLAALDLIAELEPVGRGPAMGALGWLCQHGLELGLTIRTVAASENRLHLWAGGGITWGSEPAAEVAEAAAKAAPLKALLREFDR